MIYIGIFHLATIIAASTAAVPADDLRDYAGDPGFVESFRNGAIEMARRKSAALGESPSNAPVRVGRRIATGGKFTGHYLWDAAFSVFWAVHAPKGALPIASTLDNFYRFAEDDGYIGREFLPDGTPTWDPEHPVSFNPPMLTWAELELADSPSAEQGRLARVYPSLVRHHRSCERKFRRSDGLYFGCGLGCGMDDTPRWPHGFTPDQRAAGGIPLTEESINPAARGMWKRWLHRAAKNHSWNRQAGWIDMSAAMALDARSLAEMARRLGKPDDAKAFGEEHAALSNAINRLCWDEATGFYYDVTDSGIIPRRHLGALWVLVSHVAPPERVDRMIRTLFDPEIFYRTVPLASLEAGDPDYTTEREYFKGPAWPNLNFLAIRGLVEYGHRIEAEKLARRWYNCCAALYEKTGGIYENLSSEQYDHPKERSYPDYAGHGCLTPVALPAMFGWGREGSKCRASISFTTPDGARGCVCEVGGGLWRIRLADGDGRMREKGAVQSLAAFMGEDIPSFGEPDGSRVEVADRPFALRFYSASGRLVRTITGLSVRRHGFSASGALGPDEGVYGFGERFDRLNQRGCRLLLCSYDGWNRSDTTYAPVPFFVATSGAGLFVNDYCAMTADMGASKPDEWRIDGEGGDLDVYVWATDRMMDAVKGVHRIQGGSLKPPDWSLGPVVSRYSPDLTVLDGYTAKKYSNGKWAGKSMLGVGVKETLKRYDEMGARPSALVLEGLDVSDVGGEGAVQRREELRRCGEFLRSKDVKMIVYMRLGAPVATRSPGYSEDFLVHADVESGGAAAELGTTLIPDVYFNGVNPNPDSGKMLGRHVALDITNDDMWRWYIETVWKHLVDIGVAGVKIDFCEELPDDGRRYGQTTVRYRWRNPSVFEGVSVHHAYPAFFVSRFAREMSRMTAERGGFLVLTRGGGIGSGRSPYMWAGDQTRSWEKLDDQVLAVLNSGMSGMPFMCYDCGGYQYEGGSVAVAAGVINRRTGLFDFSRNEAGEGEDAVCVRRGKDMTAEEEERIFSRALSFTAFMPCIQSHGFVRNAYEFGDSTRCGYVCIQRMRERLSPFLAKLAERASSIGEPVVRPLVLCCQDDPNVRSLGDEFMLGDALLVAPLLDSAVSRRVYLPRGRWREVSSGRHLDVGEKGAWLMAAANGVMPPLYVNLDAQDASVLLGALHYVSGNEGAELIDTGTPSEARQN